MKKKSVQFIALLLMGLAMGMFLGAESGSSIPILEKIEKVDLNFGDVICAYIVGIAPLENGFVLLTNESVYGDKYSLLKLSERGEFIKQYNKRGNGPGEFSRVGSLVVLEKSILVFERSTPFIHEFTFDLEFVRDHRVKQGGKGFLLGNFVAVQGLYFTGGNKDKKNYVLALYDRETFEFKKYAVEVNEVPAFVFTWGGFCEVDNKTIAGVYSNIYEVQLFDRYMNKSGALEKKISGHFEKYYPWKKNPNTLRNDGVKWMHSWAKMHSIFFLEDKFIITYLQNKKYYWDVISMDGKPVAFGLENKADQPFLFTTNSHIWRLETTEVEDEKEYAIIQMRFKKSETDAR